MNRGEGTGGQGKRRRDKGVEKVRDGQRWRGRGEERKWGRDRGGLKNE